MLRLCEPPSDGPLQEWMGVEAAYSGLAIMLAPQASARRHPVTGRTWFQISSVVNQVVPMVSLRKCPSSRFL